MSAGADSRKLVSIVIPAWNECDVLEELARRLRVVMDAQKAHQFEVTIIDNGSWDDSWEKLQEIHRIDPRFRILQLTRNFMADGAVQVGLRLARGEAVVIMDADLQDPPEMIGRFLEEWERGAEISYGVIERREGVPWIKRALAKIYYVLLHRLTRGAMPVDATGFRLMDRRVVHTLNRMGEHNRFTRGLSIWGGFRSVAVPYARPARYAGETKAPFSDLVEEAWNGIYAFSYLPLKLPFYIGWPTLVAGITVLVVQGVTAVRGVPTSALLALAMMVLVLFGTLFLILGLIGEYVRRICDEVRDRPGYVIRESIGFENPPEESELAGPHWRTIPVVPGSPMPSSASNPPPSNDDPPRADDADRSARRTIGSRPSS